MTHAQPPIHLFTCVAGKGQLQQNLRKVHHNNSMTEKLGVELIATCRLILFHTLGVRLCSVADKGNMN